MKIKVNPVKFIYIKTIESQYIMAGEIDLYISLFKL